MVASPTTKWFAQSKTPGVLGEITVVTVGEKKLAWRAFSKQFRTLIGFHDEQFKPERNEPFQ